MIIGSLKEMQDQLSSFKDYGCVIIICKYNGGKSSLMTDMIHNFFGEDNTYYLTFVDQRKNNFTPRKSRLKFNELVKEKIVVFDEIDDEEKRDVKPYLKKLIENNLVIILSNLYGSSNDSEKEIRLFKEQEKDILPANTLFIFVKTPQN
ncbi:hypothetical protein HYU21_04595 [Candidatus Woesearchaeota archaeon]|nr:hypothetical protein [Candidatus Woesearchaeota archaeon]